MVGAMQGVNFDGSGQGINLIAQGRGLVVGRAVKPHVIQAPGYFPR